MLVDGSLLGGENEKEDALNNERNNSGEADVLVPLGEKLRFWINSGEGGGGDEGGVKEQGHGREEEEEEEDWAVAFVDGLLTTTNTAAPAPVEGELDNEEGKMSIMVQKVSTLSFFLA